MTNDYRIRFGTVGWHHPQWFGDFYPEDLPEDWLLAYYGNEFSAVAVPADIWTEDPAGQIDEWRDNSDEHFRFIFECQWTNAEELRTFCQRLAPISSQSLGLLLQVPWSVCCQPNELLSILTEITPDFPVCLEIMDDDGGLPKAAVDFSNTGFRDLLEISSVSCCWHGTEANHDAFFRNGTLGVVKISDILMDAKQMRQVLEVCSAQVQSLHDMVVLFAGHPPALKNLRDAMVMVELLA